MKSRTKQILIQSGALTLACFGLLAGERVEFKGSTSIELPKPKRTIDPNRKMKVDDERPSLEGGFVTVPIDSSPLSDKRMRDALDRKKNWIYMDPKKSQFDSKTEEFMKGEKGTSLYNNKWMNEEDDKSLVQKFMEEKNSRGKDSKKDDDNNSEHSDRSDRSDRSDSKEKDGLGSDPRDEKDPRSEERNSPLDLRSAPGLGLREAIAAPEIFSVDKRLDKNPLAESPFGSRKPTLSAGDKEEMKQQQIAHDREFDQIMNTRLGSTPVGGRLDALSTAPSGTRLDVSPIGGQRSDQLLNFGRSSGPTTVTFSGGGGSSIPGRGGFGGGSFSESISAKAPQASPFAAPVSAAPIAPRPAFTQTPFTFSAPQRKF